MKLIEDNGYYIEFECTGRRKYCFAHVIGACRNDEDGSISVSYGYDGNLDYFSDKYDEFDRPSLTKEERQEMARYMVALWADYGELAAKVEDRP